MVCQRKWEHGMSEEMGHILCQRKWGTWYFKGNAAYAFGLSEDRGI